MNRTALTYVSDKLAKSITHVGDERAKTIHSRASRFEIGKLCVSDERIDHRSEREIVFHYGAVSFQ
jgi:hypothetical protein